jgi:transketolase
VPTLDRSRFSSAAGLLQGAYLLNPDTFPGRPDAILIASGSEVAVIVGAEKLLAERGFKVALVSMPSWELFREQSREYREKILPPDVAVKVAVETGVSQGWHQWVGENGAILALDRYGISAPGPRLMKEFGFTAENVAGTVFSLLGAK